MPAPAAHTARDALLHQLRQRHPELPRVLAQAARHLLDHPTEAALGTVSGIAAAAGVQPSALVRLAQALGYAGFSDLQAVLRTALAQAAPSYQERVRARAAGTGGLLREICELNELSLRHLADTAQDKVDRAAAILAGAGAVHVVGQRRSHAVAVHLAYGLTRAGKLARLLAGPGGTLRDEALVMRGGDALLAVRGHPSSAEVEEVCALARGRGAAEIALTDGPLSPLDPVATIAFDVRDAELSGFRSLVAQMCLSQALVFGVAARLPLPMRDGRATP